MLTSSRGCQSASALASLFPFAGLLSLLLEAAARCTRGGAENMQGNTFLFSNLRATPPLEEIQHDVDIKRPFLVIFVEW